MIQSHPAMFFFSWAESRLTMEEHLAKITELRKEEDGMGTDVSPLSVGGFIGIVRDNINTIYIDQYIIMLYIYNI